MPELDQLSAEAELLLRELREYEPTDDERDMVQTLLAAEPHIPERYKWRIIGERRRSLESVSKLVRQVQKEQLEKSVEDWNHRVRLDLWCLRLAFPTLSKEEIVSARPRLGPTAWRKAKRGHMWLLKKRLGIDPKLVAQQLSRYRSVTPST